MNSIVRNIFFKALFGVFGLALLAGCAETPRQEMSQSNFSPEFLKNLQTVEVVLEAVQQPLQLSGNVDYDPDRVVYYTALVEGLVEKTNFKVGDKVQRGQTLILAKSVELSELQAEKKSLEAELAIQQREVESVKSMYNDNLASQKEWLEAQGQLRQVEAELEKVNFSLSLYGDLGNTGQFAIKAPISGYIIERNIAPGMQISPDGEHLFHMADLSRVWVVANVHAGDLTAVKEGLDVEIRTFAYPGEVFHGKINIIPQVFDAEERVLKVHIIMPNDLLKLKPGMAVDITVKNNDSRRLPAIPSQALIFDNNRHFVIKQVNNDFVITEVTRAAESNGISYLSSGLAAGDRIVVKNQLLMYSQLKEE